jgi:hypothetical protein
MKWVSAVKKSSLGKFGPMFVIDGDLLNDVYFAVRLRSLLPVQ